MYTAAFIFSLADAIGGSIARQAKTASATVVYNKLLDMVNGDTEKLTKLYNTYQERGNNINAALAISNPFSSGRDQLTKRREENNAKLKEIADEQARVQREGQTALDAAQHNINNASTGSLTGDVISSLINGGSHTEVKYNQTKL